MGTRELGSGTVLASMGAAGHVGPFKSTFKSIKSQKMKDSVTWPVATLLDSADENRLHQYTRFYWTMLL